MKRLKREPAVVIGIVFAALLAAMQSLAGNAVIGQDVVDTAAKAVDPNSGGWLIPVLAGWVTRFFVSPASSVG